MRVDVRNSQFIHVNVHLRVDASDTNGALLCMNRKREVLYMCLVCRETCRDKDREKRKRGRGRGIRTDTQRGQTRQEYVTSIVLYWACVFFHWRNREGGTEEETCLWRTSSDGDEFREEGEKSSFKAHGADCLLFSSLGGSGSHTLGDCKKLKLCRFRSGGQEVHTGVFPHYSSRLSSVIDAVRRTTLGFW